MESGSKLRELATVIRHTTANNEAIASAFELIADAMEPCIDCGKEPEPDGLDNVIHILDNPATGV